jgi:hypothetical protein
VTELGDATIRMLQIRPTDAAETEQQ